MIDDLLHPKAALGFSREAHTYAKARPDYPEATLDWLRNRLDLGPGRCVLEVGAGTGKFTQRLLQAGATVLALEPVDEMRAELESRHPEIDVCKGVAAHLPFDEQSVDAIVCAQAFHWFAASEVLDEFARVLKPDGTLGLVWNVRDETVEWVRRLGCLLHEHEVGLPRYTPELVRALFPHSKFGPLQQVSSRHTQTGPAELVVVERIRSTSFIASMASIEQEQFLERVREILRTEHELRGADLVAFPYCTDMFSAQRC